jgi:IS5 family transposase
VVDQAIRYPTELSLLNEAREFSEQIIDELYPGTPLRKKPRTYRLKARRQYLAVAKRRRAGARVIRKAIKQQLQYLRRNLAHIEQLLSHFPEGAALPLPNWLLRRLWVIPHLYAQQLQMHETKLHRCDDRIVSICQPWVRPIVRGKQHKSTEFGAKINVSLDADGLARIDRHSWDAFHEGNDLPEQVQGFYERYGHYPEVVIADNIYGTRSNRAYLKDKGIRFAGKPLGRPPKENAENAEQLKADKKQREKEYRQRIPIEGKFGQGKGAYRMNYIRAKRSDTSISWVNSIFFVMNLLVLFEWYFLSIILTMKRLSTHRFGWRSLPIATVGNHCTVFRATGAVCSDRRGQNILAC